MKDNIGMRVGEGEGWVINVNGEGGDESDGEK